MAKKDTQYTEITLFKDGGRYSDDVAVTVNGENYLIQRGVPVSVPLFVAQAVANAMRQKNEAAAFINSLLKNA